MVSQSSRALSRWPEVILAGVGVFLLAAVVVLRASGSPSWYKAGHLNVLYLVAGGVLFLVVAARADFDPFWWGTGHLLFGALAAIFIVRQMQRYIPQEARLFHVFAVFVVFVAYPLTLPRSHEFLRDRWPYFVAFVVVLGAYFVHVNRMGAGSGKAAFVVFVTLVFGANLLFIPRTVPRDAFLGALAALPAAVVGVGLLAYPFGEYSIASFPVRLYRDTSHVPLVGWEFHWLQSIFQNPNGLGVFAFAGAVAAFVLAHQLYEADRPALALLSGVLFVLNALGTFLSWSRASWLAAAVGIALYVAAVVGGRRTLPYVFGVVVALTMLFLAGVYADLLPVDASGRFVLWGASMDAVAAAPGPFGYGVVNLGDVIGEYIAQDGYRGYGPHNSYLKMFLNTGLIGGLAFLVLTVGAVVHGVVRRETVNLPTLALATGFVVHLMFEAYTTFDVAVPSVVSTLAFGYLIADGARG